MRQPLPAVPSGTEPLSRTRKFRRLRRASIQGLIILCALALVGWFALAVRAGLARNGISFNMGFLEDSAGFNISEGMTLVAHGLQHFDSGDSNLQALLAGLFNTIKASALAIVLSTILGTLLGIALVSRNWLVRKLSFGAVEFIRNTPLLIQLAFWYFAAVLKLPGLQDASSWLGGVIASQQGVYFPLPALHHGPQANVSLAVFLVGVACGAAALHWRRHRVLLIAVAGLALLSSILLGFPFSLQKPHVDGFIVSGGFGITPEFTAIMLGLTAYTAAFLAEIVRGAIVSLPAGQWEASAALGLSRAETFRDIVIPQVYRIVLPAFGNQYISLIKNSSLGIAIGYPDLFNVYGTVANQSGRSLEGVIVVMLVYLVLSWIVSLIVNFYNRKLLLAGGAQ